jgi:hypothetical protein
VRFGILIAPLFSRVLRFVHPLPRVSNLSIARYPPCSRLHKIRRSVGSAEKALSSTITQRMNTGYLFSPSQVREFPRVSKGSNYEFDFVSASMLPSISEYLRQNLSPADAVKAFLAESVDARKSGLASGTPAGANRHLFTKVLGVSAKSLVKMWWGTGKEKPLSQSCPDWAFRKPCPHTVVFECKLFRKGGMDAAKLELVKSIYQCFTTVGNRKFQRATPMPSGITIMRA